MLVLETVTHEDFAACLEQSFTIDDEAAGSVEVELIKVELRGAFDPDTQSRPPFSIVFLGKSEPLLPQGIYRMRHPRLGAMELFVVPVGVDAKGVRYEAVFA